MSIQVDLAIRFTNKLEHVLRYGGEVDAPRSLHVDPDNISLLEISWNLILSEETQRITDDVIRRVADYIEIQIDTKWEVESDQSKCVVTIEELKVKGAPV